MKKYLSVFLVIVMAFSMATYGYASQRFTTDVTLTVGGDGGGTTNPGDGETPNPNPGGEEKPNPNPDGEEKPNPNPGGEEKPNPNPGGEEKPNPNPGDSSGGRPSRPSGGGGGGSRPSAPNTKPAAPNGVKPGGVDGKGNPYYLIEGVYVAAGIHEDGYMRGYTNMTFGPDDFLTRAQFATIMDRVFEFDEVAITKSFDDTRGHWAENAINRLASRGVILGVSSTEFRPNDGLTKGHVLLMLSRVLDIAKYSKVSNLPSVKQYHAKEAVARMLNSGIYDELDKDFDVNARITRSEMVHLLNNLIYERNAKATRTERVLESRHIFLDLIENRWHMYYHDSVKSMDYNYLMQEVRNFEM